MASNPSLERLAELYLVAKRAEGRSDKTVSLYRHVLVLFRGWVSDELGRPATLAALSADNTRRWAAWLVESGRRGTGTALQYQAHLKAHAAWLAAEGLVAADPLARVKVPPLPKREPRTITDEELARIVACCDRMLHPLRNKAIILLMADTGVRVSGLCGLDMADVSMPTAKVAEGRVRVVLKGRDEITVPFGRKAAQALLHYTMLEREPRLLKADPYADIEAGPLFLTRLGERVKAKTVEAMVKDAAALAGIVGKKVSPHGYRHYAGSSWAAQNLNAFQIRDRLGHKTLETSSLYVHLAEQRQDYRSALDAAKAIDPRLLKPPRPVTRRRVAP